MKKNTFSLVLVAFLFSCSVDLELPTTMRDHQRVSSRILPISLIGSKIRLGRDTFGTLDEFLEYKGNDGEIVDQILVIHLDRNAKITYFCKLLKALKESKENVVYLAALNGKVYIYSKIMFKENSDDRINLPVVKFSEDEKYQKVIDELDKLPSPVFWSF